jgi:hypothetical protein
MRPKIPGTVGRSHAVRAVRPVGVHRGQARWPVALLGHRAHQPWKIRRVLAVREGKPALGGGYLGRAVYGVESDVVLQPGKHTLRFEFEPTGKPDMTQGKGAPGRLQLYVDGTLAGNAEAPVTTPFVLNPGALTCGANPGSAITDDYASPFKFTGTIHTATVDVSGEPIRDDEAELRVYMARQ